MHKCLQDGGAECQVLKFKENMTNKEHIPMSCLAIPT